ncbi:MAG: DNA primase [bacterium]|nr:DNA primase [bacterium]
MDDVQEIKSRIDIIDTIQDYLPLKPAGSGSFKGLCPFHGENTPSFFGNRPRQSWHCFGCDQGGDLFDFVMRMEGMEFREALELLAQKAGVTLTSQPPKDRSEKQRIFEINAQASKWFRNQLLNNPTADHARTYAETRGIDSLNGDIWKIGYAPDGWDALTDALKAEGITESELVLAGLAGQRQTGSGIYSRFRDRLMFTISDRNGNCVGFTGRLLTPDAKESKYVNTPETPVYKKSEILYGLEKAKGDIKRNDLVVIVEGNMDVITSHIHGVQHVVASSGTALTELQLHLIKRYTSNIAFAFDADAGGIAAAKRGVDLARQMGFSIRMILLPDGVAKDPDELIRKDVTLWKDAIASAPEYIEWLYRLSFRSWGGHDPESKKKIAQDLLPEFLRIQSPIERDSWIVRLSDDLGVATDAIRDAIHNAQRTQQQTKRQYTQPFHEKPPLTNEPEQSKEKSRLESLREQLMAYLLIKPELRELAESTISEYTPASEEIEERASFLAILADHEIEDRSEKTMQWEFERIVSQIRTCLDKERRQDIEQQMKDAERIGDTERIRTLSAEFQKLF